jgi:hypothetical protein
MMPSVEIIETIEIFIVHLNKPTALFVIYC